MKAVLAALFLLLLTAPSLAVRPDEMLKDPVLEARARDISADLRCLVCQNQSVDGSDADLAHDIRVIVRERLTAGDTDQQAIDFIVARYGEYVLLNPRVEPQTILLWIAAPVLLLAGGIAIWFGIRRRRGLQVAATAPLSAEEQAALDELTRNS